MTFAKRALDVVGSSVGIVVLLPVFVLVGAAIVVEGGRPVFFTQERAGRDGVPFRIWKFRTMVRDAERRGPPLTIGADPRVTRVGRVLRATKLDELPQLFNVLAGTMSLVGPRPEVRRYVDRYSPDQRRVLRLTPGITDPASLSYRNETRLLASVPDPENYYITHVMGEKIGLNLAYAERATWRSDVRVIWATVTGATRFDLPGTAVPRRRSQHP